MSALPTLRRACTWLVLFCGLALGALAAAAPGHEAATEQVRARLLAQDASVQPGRPLVLGLQQRIAPHWHTYGREPGDVGQPTTIAWALPAGATAGAIDWPAPTRFTQGPITSYGYADEVTLLTTVQVPPQLRVGDTFPVRATVDWLVCNDICIPQQVVLALQLPVQAEAPAPGPDAALIRDAQARLAAPPPVQWNGMPAALLLAFAGGLVLNLMPCVFPVLSIKALALLGHGGASRRAARLQGLAYTAGVLASFVALAGLLLVAKAGGAGVGWGFQFQSPPFVAGLALLMAAVGLNLSGVYTLGTSLTGVGASWADRDGLAGSFFTGVLATVVATPCTAPFMGAALGYALTQPAPLTLAVFLSLGLGLAAPYLLLSWWPASQRWLPRPGAWMERLKQALAFPMYAAVAWLVWVLARQAGADAVAVLLGSLVLLGLGAWTVGSTQAGAARTRRAGAVFGGLVVLAALAGTWYGLPVETASHGAVNADAWEPYSPERLQALQAEGRPVFVNLTAAWCITCLVNERVALGRPAVDAAFREARVTRLKGDWTQRDERITQLLAAHGRSGVPLYLYYAAGAAQPVVLPQVLTPDGVVAALTGVP